MRLTLRPATAADFPLCFPLIRDGFVYDASTHADLLELWSELLRAGAGISAVIKDTDRYDHQGVAGFGLSAFVSDEFIAGAKSRLPPYVGRQVLDLRRRGHSPVLTSEQVREATESDGLNVLVMHYGCRDWDYSVDEAAMIHAMLPQAFIAYHRGYRLKELLQEVYGAQELALLLNAGFLLRTDYAQHSSQSHPQVNPDRRAYLCGIARAEATGRRGTLAATVLLPSTRSRFGFADYERDFLRHAIDGATDLELARTLLLSTSTVKKRWERIYQRVEDVDSTLLPIDTPHSAEKRGIEKRRRLLAYLRTHLEEFVP